MLVDLSNSILKPHYMLEFCFHLSSGRVLEAAKGNGGVHSTTCIAPACMTASQQQPKIMSKVGHFCVIHNHKLSLLVVLLSVLKSWKVRMDPESSFLIRLVWFLSGLLLSKLLAACIHIYIK